MSSLSSRLVQPFPRRPRRPPRLQPVQQGLRFRRGQHQVAVLGPQGFRAVRLDRNRNNITTREQARLGALRIGVAGLSVGHVIAHTLAAQGLCGQLRLADFDHLELSNLNRVPATVFDLGLNKADVAARRIAELDPYLPVEVLASGFADGAGAHVFFQVGDLLFEFLQGIELGANGVGFADDFLRGLGIVPEFRFGHGGLVPSELGF